MSLKDFNIQYMINGEGIKDDDIELSTTKPPVSLSSSAQKEDPESASNVIEEKVAESPKEKLVELDKQWFVSLFLFPM